MIYDHGDNTPLYPAEGEMTINLDAQMMRGTIAQRQVYEYLGRRISEGKLAALPFVEVTMKIKITDLEFKDEYGVGRQLKLNFEAVELGWSEK